MRRGIRRLPWQLMPMILVLIIGVPVLASVAPVPDWINPSAITLKLIGPAGTTPATPYVFPSLDCDQISYRPVGLFTDMREGCFTDTAFGLMGSDQQSVIFNGSDESLPLIPFSAHELLVPWPQSAAALALDNLSAGGQMLSLYKNLSANLRDQRDLLGQLIAKQVIVPPDQVVRDASGHALIINSQTLSFSPGASWLVVETLSGYFVRINLASLDITTVAPAFNSLGGAGLSQSELGISEDGRYVAIANRQFATFKVYDLADCTGTTCAYHDYWPVVATKYGDLQAIGHVRFINDQLITFNAAGGSGSQANTYELAPTDHINSLLDYLALGDSYTSGEGAYDYLLGTDSGENSCHLSRRSYPLLLTADLFGGSGGHSVACSGAVINDLASTSNSYVGQMASGQSYNQLKQAVPAFLTNIQVNFLPGYVAQQRFVGQYQPAILTVSVSGDDAGFGDILERCVEPHLSRHQSDQTCFNTYEDRQEIIQQINKTRPKLAALYKQLLALAPTSHLYAIGYPQIVVDNGSCALNVHLDKSELEFAIELVTYLNDNMRQAAASAGVHYVDIGRALVGHRLCEAKSYDLALNGLTAGKDGGVWLLKVFGKESYHPTALGQQLIEQAILHQTNNFHDWAPQTSTPVNNGQNLLNRPKSGRSLYNRISTQKLTTHSLAKGGTASIHYAGNQAGLPPNHTFLVQLDGPSGSVIGTVVSNSNGDVDGSVIIPAASNSGGHSLDLTGPNQAGENTDVSQPVYIEDNPVDADGDGLPNSIDSCPTAPNSGQDTDRDGIDDTCDGFINQSPMTAQSVSVSTGQISTVVSFNQQSPNSSAFSRKQAFTGMSGKTLAATSKGLGIVGGSISATTVSAKQHIRYCWPFLALLILIMLLLCYKIVRRLADDE